MVECEISGIGPRGGIEALEVRADAGLYERFLHDIERFPERDQLMLRGALDLASLLHGGDRRTNEPYMFHVLRVAIGTMDYGTEDAEVVIAALLHDTVEDHSAELAELEDMPDVSADYAQVMALERLEQMFNGRIAGMIATLTIPAGLKTFSKKEYRPRYRGHVIAALRDDPPARIIKPLDVLDNTGDLDHIPHKKAMHIAMKQEPLLPVLRELVLLPDTPLSEQGKARLADELDQRRAHLQTLLS